MVSRQRIVGDSCAERRIPHVLRSQLRPALSRSPMRVAIEAASLSLSSGGLARYTAELGLALARCFPDDEFFLISDQPFSKPQGSPANLKLGGGPRNAVE